MSEIIERAAKALQEQFVNYGSPLKPEVAEMIVRAVIASMLNPPPTMEQWNAMVDTALSSPPPPLPEGGEERKT